MNAEQLAERINYVGASDAAVACGMSPYKTALELYMEKTGQIAPENLDHKVVVQVGQHLEKLVLDTFEFECGHKVVDRQAVVYSNIHPWMRATLDGRIPGSAVVEAKTASRKDRWGDTGTDQIPQEYLIQVHQQMLVTGERKAFVPVIFSGADFDWYEVNFDTGLSEFITERLVKFWDMVQRRVAPEPETVGDIGLLYKRDTGTSIVATLGNLGDVGELRIIREQIAKLEDDEAEIKKHIQLVMGPNAQLLGEDGKPIVTWKSAKDSVKTDWQAMAMDAMKNISKEQQDALIGAFSKTTPGSRRFLIK